MTLSACMFGLELRVPLLLVGATVVFLILVSVAGTVLAGRRAELNPAGGRLVTVGLLKTDLDEGFCVPHPGREPTDLDLLLATFPTLWLSFLAAEGLCSAHPTAKLDFQMDPIFDWTIFPLYMPAVGLDDGTAAGGSAATFLKSAAALFSSFCTVFTFFRA